MEIINKNSSGNELYNSVNIDLIGEIAGEAIGGNIETKK